MSCTSAAWGVVEGPASGEARFLAGMAALIAEKPLQFSSAPHHGSKQQDKGARRKVALVTCSWESLLSHGEILPSCLNWCMAKWMGM